MNKELFFNLTPAKRVVEVNKMLKEHDLKTVSEMIGISSSTLSKEMRVGDYLYHQADKQYYPFVRSEAERIKAQEQSEDDEFLFISENMNILQEIIDEFKGERYLQLDKNIYAKNAKFFNKSIKMNSDIYKDFSDFCNSNYPHLKMQDIIAQALLDAMKHYNYNEKREYN